jgi:hypothetical protein
MPRHPSADQALRCVTEANAATLVLTRRSRWPGDVLAVHALRIQPTSGQRAGVAMALVRQDWLAEKPHPWRIDMAAR